MSTMRCPDCGNVNPGDAGACLACGYKLGFDASAPVRYEEPEAPPAPAPLVRMIPEGWRDALNPDGSPIPCPHCGRLLLSSLESLGVKCESCDYRLQVFKGTLRSKGSRSLQRATQGHPGVREYTLRLQLDDGSERIFEFIDHRDQDMHLRNGDELRLTMTAGRVSRVEHLKLGEIFEIEDAPKPVAVAPDNTCMVVFSVVIAIALVLWLFVSCLMSGV